MCFGLVVLCLLKKCQKSFLISWIDSKNNLDRFTKVSDFRWIDSHPLESIHTWIVSFLIESSHKTFWSALESIHKYFESYHLHPGFTWIDSYMHWTVSFCLLLCSDSTCWSIWLDGYQARGGVNRAPIFDGENYDVLIKPLESHKQEEKITKRKVAQVALGVARLVT